ncbi:hypothetical protein B0H66DRAFT_136802 [Apodospora peruviana]|uniref:Uncharacterized protein n=1 Tax=Apodospora peruviana TaxID=516989 RepID=A0AAE0MAV4_9PEZI|nr:hypothetical protein B0H66DRAFT_136802 [Apodospora peruviana]
MLVIFVLQTPSFPPISTCCPPYPKSILISSNLSESANVVTVYNLVYVACVFMCFSFIFKWRERRHSREVCSNT